MADKIRHAKVTADIPASVETWRSRRFTIERAPRDVSGPISLPGTAWQSGFGRTHESVSICTLTSGPYATPTSICPGAAGSGAEADHVNPGSRKGPLGARTITLTQSVRSEHG